MARPPAKPHDRIFCLLMRTLRPCKCFPAADAGSISSRQLQKADLPMGVLVCSRDYIKQQALYRQRVWSCKFSGAAGLTYEEAVASEH